MNYAQKHRDYKLNIETFDRLCKELRYKLFAKQRDIVLQLNTKRNEISEHVNETNKLDVILLQIDNEISKVKTTQGIGKDVIPTLTKKKAETEEINANLQREIERLTTELNDGLKNWNKCDLHFREMTQFTTSTLSALQHDLENQADVPQYISADEGKQSEEEKKQIKQDQLKAQKKIILKQALNEPHALFTIARIKCATSEDMDFNLEVNTSYIDEAGDETIKMEIMKKQDAFGMVTYINIGEEEGKKISMNKLQKKIKSNPTFEILNDNDKDFCNENTFYKTNQIKSTQNAISEIKFVLKYNTFVGTNANMKRISEFEDAIDAYNIWVEEEKQKVAFEIEFLDKNPSKRMTSDIEANRPTQKRGSVVAFASAVEQKNSGESIWISWASSYSNTFVNSFIVSEAIISKEKKDGKQLGEQEKEKIKNLFNVYKNNMQSNIATITNNGKQAIDSYMSTVIGGQQFVRGKNILKFLKKQNENNLLKSVTIVSLGGSGSGKTTVSKSLLAYIITTYTTIFSNFIREAKISVSFQEIYMTEDDDKKPLFRYLSTKLSKSDKLDQESKTVTDDSDYWHVLCDKNCGSISGKNITALQKLRELENASDSNRKNRVTLNNTGGSSRSVKITQVKFDTTNQTVFINLIDTAGYEDYSQSKSDLISYYQDELNFITSKDKTGRTRKTAEYYANKTIEEGKFINQSLTYVEKVILKYNSLQQAAYSRYAPFIEYKIPHVFEEELNKIQQNNLIIEEKYIPRKKYTEAQVRDEIEKDKQKEQTILPNDQINLSWMTPYLPADSTLILLTTFKSGMDQTEVPSARATLGLLNSVLI